MRVLFQTFLVFILAGFFTQAHARTESIAAVVNDEAISMSEVNDRVRLLMVSSGLSDTAEIRRRMTNQVLGVLIEEQIKMQQAEEKGIEVSPAEIRQGFATIAAQNNFTAPQFRGILERSNINPATLERQIKSQIGWSKVVQQSLRSQVILTDNDIQAHIERMRANIGKTEYLSAEIFLPVEERAREDEVRALAERLVQEVKFGKAPFFKVAQQFSKAPGAAKGGDTGWVSEDQMPQALSEALSTMEKGDISDPVRTVTGYHIMFLREKRTMTEDTIPSEEEVRQKLGLERLERLGARYLQDLKTSAFIENRVNS